MANELIKIEEFKSQIQGKSSDEIDKIVKQESYNIIETINALSQKIEKANQLSKQAENAKSDLKNLFTLGRLGESATDKRSKINTQAIILQNEAITEMNNMIQATVALILVSGNYAKRFIEQLSLIIKNAFLKKDGQTIEITEQIKDTVNLIMQQAEDGLKRHEKIENLVNNID